MCSALPCHRYERAKQSHSRKAAFPHLEHLIQGMEFRIYAARNLIVKGRFSCGNICLSPRRTRHKNAPTPARAWGRFTEQNLPQGTALYCKLGLPAWERNGSARGGRAHLRAMPGHEER